MKASRCGRVAASYPPGLPPAQEGASSCGPAGWRPAVRGGHLCAGTPVPTQGAPGGTVAGTGAHLSPSHPTPP